MAAPSYAVLLLQAGVLAIVTSRQGPPAAVASSCPTRVAVWGELSKLVTKQALAARHPPLDPAGLAIDDLGATFRISALDKVREYRDEARDCTRRARLAALFVALMVDPGRAGDLSDRSRSTDAGNGPPSELPPAPSALEPGSASAPPASPTPPAPTEPPRSRASPSSTSAAGTAVPPEERPRTEPWARLEGAAVMVGHDSAPPWAPAWGGMARAALGRGLLRPVLGVAIFLPTDTTLGGVRLREWRLPVDAGVRVTMVRRSGVWYGEVGVVAALLNERAPDLLESTPSTALEVGGRVSLGWRWPSGAALAPFLALSVDVVPKPPSVGALPQGILGQTSHVWPGACVGLSWGAPWGTQSGTPRGGPRGGQ
jgi:hypothetical protein